jgi:hypothetical protein
MKTPPYEGPSFKVSLEEKGVIAIRIQPQSACDKEGVMAIIDAMHKLSNGDPFVVMANIKQLVGMTADARAYVRKEGFSIPHMNKIALIVGNPLSRVVGSFYIGLSRPPMPVKLFDTEEKAKGWLLNDQ